MRSHDEDNISEVTPSKQCEQEDNRTNVQSLGDNKNISASSAAMTFPKMPNNPNVKASDIHQSDETFYSSNDPIFQSAASPNTFRDYKGHCSTYFGSTFKNNSILASTKKLYNNNLFLTPIKEDDRFKPSYLNSIFKHSPQFNTNNICRRLVFDDDIDDLLGNNFMNAQNIFEEKRGVFSNFHISQLLTPQNQHNQGSQVYDQTIYGASISASDFPLPMKVKQPNSGLESPENKKTQDTLQNLSQTEIQVESQKKPINNVDLFETDDTPIKDSSQRNDSIVIEKERLGNGSNSISIKTTSSKNGITIQNPAYNNNTKVIQLSLSSLLEKNMNEQHQTFNTTGNNLKANNISIGLVSDSMNTNSNGSDAGAGKKQKTCNCKKTKCLKLYCDCFAAGELCNGDCNCFGCYNTSSSEKRTAAICTIMDRQPEAFGPKVQSNTHKKGCNCTRSGCLKKYCECYTLGVNCGEYCKCQQCKNIGNPPQGMKVEDTRPSLEEMEEQSSTKKKIFFSSTSSSLHLNQKLSQEEEEEEDEGEEVLQEVLQEEIEEEEEEDDINDEDDNEKTIKDHLALSPSSARMFTTPLKSSNQRELRSLTTADTQKKKIRLAQEQDSDLKHHIVKLSISDNNNSNLHNGGAGKSTNKKKGNITQQVNTKQVGQKPTNTHGLRSGGGEEIHVQVKGGVVQLQNKTKASH